MAHKPRLNKVIALLEEGKPAFGTFVSNGNLDGLAHAIGAGYDFVFIENEHVGMDFSQLRISFQFLLSRGKIAAQGNLQADPTPFVRVAPNTEEMNQWVLKQTLDHGAYGLLVAQAGKRRGGPRRGDGLPVPSEKGSRQSRRERGVGAQGRQQIIGACLCRTITILPVCGLWTKMARCS